MGNSWYKKSMPTIVTVEANINNIAKNISEIDGVKSVLVWGSFVKNAQKKNSVIRDLDIIAVSNIFSEDLLSITDDNIYSPFNLSVPELEDEGFDPKAVQFTKAFINIKDYNVDHWAISSDKKLLHWGAFIENKDHWEEIKEQAEKHAQKETKTNRKNLHKASQLTKNRWTNNYNHWVNKHLAGMPEGWYELKCDINEILKETQKIL
jgi:hypothetical protein